MVNPLSRWMVGSDLHDGRLGFRHLAGPFCLANLSKSFHS